MIYNQGDIIQVTPILHGWNTFEEKRPVKFLFKTRYKYSSYGKEYFKYRIKDGETIYYTIVGYDKNGAPYNKSPHKYGCSFNEKKKLWGKDEEGFFFIEEDKPREKVFVYRMGMTLPNGQFIEYPRPLMEERCRQMRVEPIPIIENFILANTNLIKDKINEYKTMIDPIGKEHTLSGARLMNLSTDIAPEQIYYF